MCCIKEEYGWGSVFFLKNKVAGALPCIEVGERK
jgi:hypothetical protein